MTRPNEYAKLLIKFRDINGHPCLPARAAAVMELQRMVDAGKAEMLYEAEGIISGN